MTSVSSVTAPIVSAERSAETSSRIVESHQRNEAAQAEAVDAILASQQKWREAVDASMAVYDLSRRGAFSTGATSARLLAIA